MENYKYWKAKGAMNMAHMIWERKKWYKEIRVKSFSQALKMAWHFVNVGDKSIKNGKI